jgi:hypothetical protein
MGSDDDIRSAGLCGKERDEDRKTDLERRGAAGERR